MLKKSIKKIIAKPMDWLVYSLMNDEIKQVLAKLLTEKQKDLLKKLLKFGRNHEQFQQLKQMKYYLYNLGFIDRPLKDMKTLLEQTKNSALKRQIAWELALWYANQYAAEDAKQSLHYLTIAKMEEANTEQLRKIAIIEAECYEQLRKYENGWNAINKALEHQQHPDLYLAAANLEKTLDKRTIWLNRVFCMYHLLPIEFKNRGKKTTYDDLQMKEQGSKITSGPLVSVILPAYNAEDGIQVAIESILRQTWKNIELLIVDDCSTDGTASIVQEYVAKDQRVKYFQTPTNSGPYVARNIGLQHATGEFVTVNDADDWSHAEKIELQVKHLMENPQVVANTSEHARLSEDLKLYRRGNPGIYIFPNMSSLMFRRKPVLEKVGYWDSVRFAADGEFKRRLLKTFGEASFVDLKTGPLSLPRQSRHSLTGSPSFGYNGFFMGARKAYVEMLEHYHKKAESLYYHFPLEKRLFAVPEPMKPNRSIHPSEYRSVSVVIGADFRTILQDEPNFLERIKQIRKKYETIGFMQLSKYSLQTEQSIPDEILSHVDGRKIQWLVYGEHIQTKRLIILDQFILEDEQRYIPVIQPEEVFVCLYRVPQDIKHVHERVMTHIEKHFGKTGKWYAANEKVKDRLLAEREQIVGQPISKNLWGNLMQDEKL